MSIPIATKVWNIQGKKGFDSLVYSDNVAIPALSDNDVLIKFYAVSINYRDISIPLGQFSLPTRDGVIPGSDGAGEIVAVGSKVTRFQKGSKVITIFNQHHLCGSLSPNSIATGLGGMIDGTLRQYGVINENGLVAMPKSLSWKEAATLPCAAITAWNALYGLKPVKPGDYVLTQGTGGVSCFVIQFAKVAGAKVVATTSSALKAEMLKRIGADEVLNYKEIANWGEEAKKLTPSGEGFDHVVELGGATTMAQSLCSIKMDGIISVVGWLGGTANKEPGFLECVNHVCTVRGLFVGSRLMMEEMCRAIDANELKPIVDAKSFRFEDLKLAYQYMQEQKHIGKICIEID